MKATRITFFLLLIWQASFSQWSDDFTDGDFISDPPWSGDAADFVIESNTLRLNAPPVSSSSGLFTESNIIEEATWQFGLKMTFNPSSNNYARIFIAIDKVDISSSAKGYFINRRKIDISTQISGIPLIYWAHWWVDFFSVPFICVDFRHIFDTLQILRKSFRRLLQKFRDYYDNFVENCVDFFDLCRFFFRMCRFLCRF